MFRNLTIILLVLITLSSESRSQVFLQRCDRTNRWTGSNNIYTDSGEKKEGIASIGFNGNGPVWFAKSFSQVQTGLDETGYLSLWLYVSDPDFLEVNGQILISSSAGPDSNYYSWDMSALGIITGWNELVLPISQAGKSGSPDLNAINYFRIYQELSSSIIAKLDDIRMLKTATPVVSDDPLDVQAIDFSTLEKRRFFWHFPWPGC